MALILGIFGFLAGFALAWEPTRNLLGWLLLAGFIWLMWHGITDSPIPTPFPR